MHFALSTRNFTVQFWDEAKKMKTGDHLKYFRSVLRVMHSNERVFTRFTSRLN